MSYSLLCHILILNEEYNQLSIPQFVVVLWFCNTAAAPSAINQIFSNVVKFLNTANFSTLWAKYSTILFWAVNTLLFFSLNNLSDIWNLQLGSSNSKLLTHLNLPTKFLKCVCKKSYYFEMCLQAILLFLKCVCKQSYYIFIYCYILTPRSF